MSHPLEQPGTLDTLAVHCLVLLRASASTLATAESLTAGLVASTVADVPGASVALRGGVVAYASDVKTSVLGVSASLIAEHGVVSASCASEMARAACRMFGSSLGLATTGVAGPDRQEGKPVGTVFVAVSDSRSESPGTQVRELALTGSRSEIRWATVQAVLGLLADALSTVQ